MAIKFERLVSRNVAVLLSKELDLSGLRMGVENLVRIMVVGFMCIIIVVAFAVYLLTKVNPLLAVGIGLGISAFYVAVIYFYLEYKVDERKTKVEALLPDYLQIASANIRSGISLDRAMLLAARPEFGFFSEDIKKMNMQIFGGENFNDALKDLASRYRSYQLAHAIRMMIEALMYGGAMADLLEQLSRDIRNQQLTQKEVSGQLFLYSIFIVFAGVVASPVLYGLTSQMIVVTDAVWKGILSSNPGGLPTTGLSFLRPSPPKITPLQYHWFSLAAIITITAFASLIMAAISSGSAIKGLKYLPLFILVGLAIFFIVQTIVGGLFTSIGSAG